MELKDSYAKKKALLVNDSRSECMECGKPFRDYKFVVKHYLNKHEEILKEKFDKAYFKDKKFLNYMEDPNRMMNNPST